MKHCRYIPVLCLLIAGLLYSAYLSAESMPFKKYRLLKRGMSVAEVVALVGEPDNKLLRDQYWTNMQTWFYVPGQYESQPWETVIHFNRRGYVQRIERDKIIRARPVRSAPLE